MTAITDLTWQQLQDALGVTGAVVVTGTAPNETVMIDVSKITGNNISGLTSTGVLEFFAKLFYASLSAQATANTDQPAGEKLNAFLQPATTVQPGGVVQVTMQTQLRLPVSQNLNVVMGATV